MPRRHGDHTSQKIAHIAAVGGAMRGRTSDNSVGLVQYSASFIPCCLFSRVLKGRASRFAAVSVTIFVASSARTQNRPLSDKVEIRLAGCLTGAGPVVGKDRVIRLWRHRSVNVQEGEVQSRKRRHGNAAKAEDGGPSVRSDRQTTKVFRPLRQTYSISALYVCLSSTFIDPSLLPKLSYA